MLGESSKKGEMMMATQTSEIVYQSDAAGFSGPVSVRDENRAAHGGICVTQYDRRGRRRLANINGQHMETGEWEQPLCTLGDAEDAQPLRCRVYDDGSVDIWHTQTQSYYRASVSVEDLPYTPEDAVRCRERRRSPDTVYGLVEVTPENVVPR